MITNPYSDRDKYGERRINVFQLICIKQYKNDTL